MRGRGYGYSTPRREMARRQETGRPGAYGPSWSRWSTTPSYPAMNVWANSDGAVVTAELPGCDPDNLDITVAQDTVTIKGERSEEKLPEGATYHRRERRCGQFTRSFTLPFEVAADQVEAKFEQGVLEVTLPRSEEDKPKRIEIKTG